jgi:hypothetical protein
LSETDKILGIDRLRDLQFQLADLKTKLAEAIHRREVDHEHLRQSLEYLSEHAKGHGHDLQWELNDLREDIASKVDWIKSIILERDIPTAALAATSTHELRSN